MSEKEKKCNCGCDEHGHDENCECGCEDDIVELTTEDGKKLKFYFVGTIEYKGKAYSALNLQNKSKVLKTTTLLSLNFLVTTKKPQTFFR